MCHIVALCRQPVLSSVRMGSVTANILQYHYNLSIFTRVMISSHPSVMKCSQADETDVAVMAL